MSIITGFKKWLFMKALNFVLRNVNEYEDAILENLGVDKTLTKLIDWVTDALLKLYLTWRDNHTKHTAKINMPKLEKFIDTLDAFDIRYQKGEDFWHRIEREEEIISVLRKSLRESVSK